MDNSRKEPLVSIIVITYNSSKYVLETLESAKAQTYQNIELIISDDGSTDNTVELCRSWLAENRGRFIRTDLIIVENNTGIPANCNRGLINSNGVWIKFIAGDDIILPNAVDNVINFSTQTGAEIVVSKFQAFKITNNDLIKLEIKPEEEKIKSLFQKKSEEQFKIMLKKRYAFILGLYLKREIVLCIGGFDERYRLLEDLPFLLKIVKSANQLYFLPEITVLYRHHVASVTKTKSDGFSFNPLFIEDEYKVYKKLIRPHCLKIECLARDYRFMIYPLVDSE